METGKLILIELYVGDINTSASEIICSVHIAFILRLLNLEVYSCKDFIYLFSLRTVQGSGFRASEVSGTRKETHSTACKLKCQIFVLFLIYFSETVVCLYAFCRLSEGNCLYVSTGNYCKSELSI